MLGLARAAQLARASGDMAALEVKVKPRTAPQRIKPPVAAQDRAGEDEREALSA
jgi:hypothetical protein